MSGTAARIAVNLITGFLGVGKTTAVRHLLEQHPRQEKWAVLVNEFGEVGVDGSLLTEAGVVVQEVAGGCLCCVAAPAFTTGLNRLIRQHRPDRILIEPSGLGHPAQVLSTLSGPLYSGVLELRATLCLMDARHLGSPRHREHPVFQDQIHLADVLIANKCDLYGEGDIAAFEAFAAGLDPAKGRIGLIERGRVSPCWLDLAGTDERRAAFPEAHAFLIAADGNGATPGPSQPGDWLLIEGQGDGYHRAGWLIRQHSAWPAEALRAALDGLAVERKKGIFLTNHGWQAMNQDQWSRIDAPGDGRSRLELIDSAALHSETIDRRLRGFAGPGG